MDDHLQDGTTCGKGRFKFIKSVKQAVREIKQRKLEIYFSDQEELN